MKPFFILLAFLFVANTAAASTVCEDVFNEIEFLSGFGAELDELISENPESPMREYYQTVREGTASRMEALIDYDCAKQCGGANLVSMCISPIPIALVPYFAPVMIANGCRVQLQCKHAFNQAVGLGARAWHCGWHTVIPAAAQQRQGHDLQANLLGVVLTGALRTTNFTNNQTRGFFDAYPKDNYFWLNFDSSGVMTQPQACTLANSIRTNAPLYDKVTRKPYGAFGRNLPNSNSFLGAISLKAGVPEKHIIALPTAPKEGFYKGWYYWRQKYPLTPTAWKWVQK
jgi:hypothetical protein